MREGKTKGNVKERPKGPRPYTGGPPPQKPLYTRRDIVDLRDCIDHLIKYGGSFNVRNDKHARYQFEIPGLISVQYNDFGKTCREFVRIMAWINAGRPMGCYETWKKSHGIS